MGSPALLVSFCLVSVCFGGLIREQDPDDGSVDDDEAIVEVGDVLLERMQSQFIMDMERKAANPVQQTEDATQPKIPKKTINDLYTLLLALTNLVMMQIKSTMNTPKPPPFLPPQFIGSQPLYGRRRNRREARSHQQTYNDWYYNVYMPYMNDYQIKLAKYEADMAAWNQAQLDSTMPVNPFGDITNSLSNPYYDYSKKAYNNFLYQQVVDADPQTTHAEAFNKWKCERLSTKATGDPTKIAEGQKCWLSTTQTCDVHSASFLCEDGELS